MEYYLAIKKKKILPFANSMDGPGKHYTKWNKPVRERQGPYDFTYMESNKQNKQNRNRLLDMENTQTISWFLNRNLAGQKEVAQNIQSDGK